MPRGSCRTLPTRRECLAGLGVGGAAMLTRGAMARPFGRHDSLPLRRDTLSFGVIDREHIATGGNLRDLRAATVQRLIQRIDRLQAGGGHDLIHLGALFGMYPWTAAEIAMLTLDGDGAEMRSLCVTAARHGCYLTFETPATQATGPGNHAMLIGPTGELWRQGPPGADDAPPIVRTDIGNIALLVDRHEPAALASLALRGAEIVMFASASEAVGAAAIAAEAHQLFCIGRTHQPCSPAAAISEAGDIRRVAAIFDPRGRIVSRAPDAMIRAVSAPIELGRWRRLRRAPEQAGVAPPPDGASRRG